MSMSNDVFSKRTHGVLRRKAAARLLVGLFFLAAALAPAQAQPRIIGEHLYDKILETPHPYPLASSSAEPELVWSDDFYYPGAAYLVAEFKIFDLAPGDYVEVTDFDHKQIHIYEGQGFLDQGGDFIAKMILGERMVINLYSKNTGPRRHYGYRIERISRGFSDWELAEKYGWNETEAICGTNNQKDAVCYQSTYPDIYARSRAVARIMMDGKALCTAWLISCDNHVMTNNHCTWDDNDFDTQGELNRMEFQFGYQDTSCGGSGASVEYSFVGGTWLENHKNLDYTLIKAPTGQNPAGTYGHIQVDYRLASVDEQMYIVGHPSGRPKEISWESTHSSDASGFCEVYSTSEPVCVGGTVPEIGYMCDTEGGNSGSPVLAYATHKAIALHHCANCPNRGVRIQNIWDNNQAGSNPLPACSKEPAPNLKYSSHSITDSPNGNNNGIVDPGETITMPVTLLNSGDAKANSVTATLSTTTSGITISTASASFGSIAAGKTGTSASPHYVYTVASSVPCGTAINFTLAISATEGTWSSGFTVNVGVSPTSNTYSSTDVPKTISDQSSLTSSLNIGVDNTIGDIHCTVDISHTYIGDLIVELRSPGSAVVVRLHNRTGSSADDIKTTFDLLRAPDGPGVMNDFNGLSTLGTWTLFISDNAKGDTGTLNAWSLNVTPLNCTPYGSCSALSCSSIGISPSATACLGTAQTFTLNYSGGVSPYTVQWDWTNDGTYDATGNGISYTYPSAGSFTVRGRVTDSCGSGAQTCSLTTTVTINAPAATTPGSASPNPACPGQSVSFTTSSASGGGGSPYTYEWDVDGNGTVDYTGQNISHAYGAAGSYNAYVRARGVNGCNSAWFAVPNNPVVVTAPAATTPGSATPNPTCAGQSVSFTTSAASGGGGSPYTYEWDVDGNGSVDYTGQNISHAYGATGSYNAYVRVRGANGCNSAWLAVPNNPVIVNAPPSATFTHDAASPDHCLTDAVNFSGPSGGGGSGTLDDTYPNGGTTSTVITAAATTDFTMSVPEAFTTSGVTTTINMTPPSRNTTLTVSLIHPNGTTTQVIYNGARNSWANGTFGPYATFDGLTTQGLWTLRVTHASGGTGANNNGTLSAWSTAIGYTGGSSLAYAWDFDYPSGTDSTAQNPTHTYGTTGLKTVRLTTSDGTCSSFTEQTINVINCACAAVASFTSTSPDCDSEVTSFTNTSTGALSYHWDFTDDGAFDSTATNPTNNYAPGTYTVRLRAYESAGQTGCFTEATGTVTINANPTPVITGATTRCAADACTTLDAGAGYASYLWSTGETTRTICVTGTATRTVTVTTAAGCAGTSPSHTLTENANPTPTIVETDNCAVDGTVTLDAGAGYSSYSWNTGATARTIVVAGDGASYTVTVTDGNGCQGSDGHATTICPPAGDPPGEVPTPAEWSDVDTYAWPAEPDAEWYNIYRDEVASLATGAGNCRAPNVSSLSWTETESPNAGATWFYLISAENSMGEGPLGADSDAVARVAATPCP